MDIAIINTWLVTFEGIGLGMLKHGALGIENGRIIYVGTMENFDYQSADIIIDGRDSHITMPGLINAHTHSMLTLCRGTVHDMPEIEYMPKGLNLFANHLKGEDFILGTKMAVLEGIKAGTTTFTEYGIGLTELVNKVYLPFNARVVATEMISELNFSDEKKPEELYNFYPYLGKNAFRRANKLFNEFKENELVTVMYGPNALDMVSLDLIKSIKDQAIKNGTSLHMHIAQGRRERIQLEKRYGKDMTAIKLLNKNELLDTKLIAAHIHDTTEEERALMVHKGVKMVGCPSSISKIDGLVPPIGSYLQLGGKVGIGTDEAPGTGHHNLFTEIRMASLLTKVIYKDPTVLPPWHSLKLATLGGAEVLSLENKIGSLKVGKCADVITLDLNQIHLTPIISKPFINLIANIVYSSRGTEVDNVIIAGKVIMLNNKLLNINEEVIIKEANKRGEQIFENLTEDWLKTDSRMVNYHKQGYI
jgi:5-methylthioadenosine/S-adenosylhomocysteine deaminase